MKRRILISSLPPPPFSDLKFAILLQNIALKKTSYKKLSHANELAFWFRIGEYWSRSSFFLPINELHPSVRFINWRKRTRLTFPHYINIYWFLICRTCNFSDVPLYDALSHMFRANELARQELLERYIIWILKNMQSKALIKCIQNIIGCPTLEYNVATLSHLQWEEIHRLQATLQLVGKLLRYVDNNIETMFPGTRDWPTCVLYLCRVFTARDWRENYPLWLTCMHRTQAK